MNVGIVGLGLIGGSLAKAYKTHPENTVYGFDADDSVLDIAKISGAVDGLLDKDSVKKCDCILIALYPEDTVAYVKRMAPAISKNTIVFDCCGVKRFVCGPCFAAAKKFGFTFVGGHPMAGITSSGFKYSRANLFKGASMVLVPPQRDINLIGLIETLLEPVGFGKLTITTAEKHDEMIAFTSQMAHLVSNAYIKSGTAKEHRGYSAGSYKDMTRVARLNAGMWTELFDENRDNLIHEIDILTDALAGYREALEKRDTQAIKSLLEEGNRIKEEIDGR